MKKEIDRIAISQSMAPQEAWLDVSRRFRYNSPVLVVGMSRNQVIKRFHNARSRHYGTAISTKVETPPLALVSGTQLYFFQFHYVWRSVAKNGVKLKRPVDRVIGWGHPALIPLLSYNQVTLFIDGTFDCVPAGFQQCIIVMVYDEASKLFLPIFYVLSTSKTKETYGYVLQMIQNVCAKEIVPGQVVCDFERALLDAVCTRFPDSDVLGCYFHFKQACQRKLAELRIPKTQIKIAMTKGALDMLTVIDPARIWKRGAIWVRDKIKLECEESAIAYSASTWKAFWRYFERTWVKSYDPEVWNVWPYVSKDGEKYERGQGRRLVSRTNNPLERFNRTLNQAFGTAHPSIEKFIRTIEKISSEHVHLRNAVLIGEATSPDRKTTLELPDAVIFEDDDGSDSDPGGLSDDDGQESEENFSDDTGSDDESS